jgi:hypothetical protein
MEHSSQNIGDVPLDMRAVFEIYRVNFSSLFGGEVEPYYSITGEPRIVLAGANFSSAYSTVIDVKDGPNIDALPFIGLVKFVVTSEGQISGVDAEVENGPIVRYYLVFPWKWVLVLLIPVIIYTSLKMRKRRVNLESLEPVTEQKTANPPRIAIRRPEPKVEQPILRRYEPPPIPSWYSTPEPAPKPKRFSLRPRVQAKPQVEDPLEALKNAVSRMEKQFNDLNTDFAATKAPEIRDIAPKPKRVPKPKATTPTRNKVDASKLGPEATTLPKKPAAKKPAAGSAKKS